MVLAMAQALGPSTAQLAPPVIQSGPNAETTLDLRLPDRLEKLFEQYTKMTDKQAPTKKSAKCKTKGARKE